MRPWCPWAGVLLLAGCSAESLPARGQVVLTILTDAPLPRAWDETVVDPPDEPPPLFDRARLDVYPAGADVPCEGCTRVIDLDRRMVDGGGLSFGLVTETTAYVVRVRLFRRDGQVGDEPDAYGVLDAWIEAPRVAEGLEEQLWFVLPTDRVAQPLGSRDAPVAANRGPHPSQVVGTWPHARRTPCSVTPKPDEVCVPGGAFWMGNPRAEGFAASGIATQRLVVSSPFLITATEVSVRSVREADVVVPSVAQFSGSADGDEDHDWCTYSDDGTRDALPMTCLSWAEARAYCATIGGDLPTEAQLEYLGGGLESRLYPWGNSEPTCADAVFGRGTEYYAVVLGLKGYSDLCAAGGIGGPLPVERADFGRDIVPLPDGAVVDIAGNLLEVARDRFEPYGGECWPAGVLFDPHCKLSPGDATATYRAGNWAAQAREQLRAAFRQPVPVNARGATEGFRCVRPGTIE